MSNRIFVLCDYPFPEGMAPTNRILAYAKGLNGHDIKCEVLTFTPHIKNENEQMNLQGSIDGIVYHYSHAYNPKGNKFYRVFVDLRLFRIKAINLLLKETRKEKIDLVLISFDYPHHLLFFIPLLRLLNFKLAFIIDEFPSEIRKLKSKISLSYKIFYKIIHKAFSFRITMTNALKDFYNNEIVKKPTYILNSITDIDRFTGVVKPNSHSHNICYLGNMELAKDNVDNIIQAFMLICRKYEFIKLQLYGSPNKNDLNTISNLIKQKHLDDRVFLNGKVNYHEVPKILSEAYILVTSQPKTRRAQGGFPTKLGEYLMSGTPTVLTNVGEIGNYIKDGENAYLVEPSNPKQYADKLEFIINNYQTALNVAELGRQYIIDNFSCSKATLGLKDFLLNYISK